MQHQKQMSWQLFDCDQTGPASVISAAVSIRSMGFALAGDQEQRLEIQSYSEGCSESTSRVWGANSKRHVLQSLQKQSERYTQQSRGALCCCTARGQHDASHRMPVCQSPQQGWRNGLIQLAAKQCLWENSGLMCSSEQSNLIQSQLVSSQVRNYRERRNCGFCLFIRFKYVASAKVCCQMENIGWEVLKKGNGPKRRVLCATAQNPQGPSPL